MIRKIKNGARKCLENHKCFYFFFLSVLTLEKEKIEKIKLQYAKLLNKFLEDSKKLLFDAGMTEAEIEESTKEIRELLEFIKEDEF